MLMISLHISSQVPPNTEDDLPPCRPRPSGSLFPSLYDGLNGKQVEAKDKAARYRRLGDAYSHKVSDGFSAIARILPSCMLNPTWHTIGLADW
jgi:hypothetical protein